MEAARDFISTRAQQPPYSNTIYGLGKLEISAHFNAVLPEFLPGGHVGIE